MVVSAEKKSRFIHLAIAFCRRAGFVGGLGLGPLLPLKFGPVSVTL